jgi:hypothetical protein
VGNYLCLAGHIQIKKATSMLLKMVLAGEPQVFFGDCIFERKIFEQNYSKALFCKLFSTAMVLRKMFDTKNVRYRNIFDAAFSGGAGGGSPLNFDINPLAGVQGATAP